MQRRDETEIRDQRSDGRISADYTDYTDYTEELIGGWLTVSFPFLPYFLICVICVVRMDGLSVTDRREPFDTCFFVTI
jgi:hypothetical protein